MIDGDNMSLESFDSTSTSSSVYFRANQRLSEAKTNWREFERHPTPGSTGLTPAKPPRSQNGFNHHTSSSPLNATQYQTSLSSIPMITVSGVPSLKPSEVTRLKRSVSPLTISPSTSSALHTSTPMRRINSDSATMRKSNVMIRQQPQANQSATTNSYDEDDDIDIPILRFDNSNLSALEESTLEDRKRAHIFPIPQKEDTDSFPPPMESSKSRSVPEVRTAFLDDDDASDYDHLSPRKDPTRSELVKQNDSSDSNTTESGIYSRKDIDDAFEALDSSGSSNGSSVPSPMAEIPPPIPPKKNEAHYRLHTGSQDSTHSDASGSLSPTSPTSPTPITQNSDKQQFANYSGNNNNNISPQHIFTTKDKPKPKSPQKPPPVPLKTRRIQRFDQVREDPKSRHTGLSVHKHSTQTGQQSSIPGAMSILGGEHNSSPEDEIFPPPPEFAQVEPLGGDEPNTVSLSQGSDLLSSVSNSTLVDEPMEGSSDSGVGSKYTAAVSQRTKAEIPPPVPAHSTHSSIHSRNMGYSMKIKDRIVIGAEDPKQVKDSSPPTQKQQQLSSRPIQAYQNNIMFRNQQHKPQITSISRLPPHRDEHLRSPIFGRGSTPQNSKFPTTNTRTSSLSVIPTSPRNKHTMEMAFNEGNLLIPPNHKAHQLKTATELPTNFGRGQNTESTRQQIMLRGRSVSLTTSNQNASSAVEEQKQQGWKTFNSRPAGVKPPSLKSTSVQDSDLNALFNDLDIKDSLTQSQPSSYGRQTEIADVDCIVNNLHVFNNYNNRNL